MSFGEGVARVDAAMGTLLGPAPAGEFAAAEVPGAPGGDAATVACAVSRPRFRGTWLLAPSGFMVLGRLFAKEYPQDFVDRSCVGGTGGASVLDVPETVATDAARKAVAAGGKSTSKSTSMESLCDAASPAW